MNPRFIVLGLTGRTGSGCTTTAKLLSRSLEAFPPALFLNPPQTPEERKHNIVLRHFQQSWQPFQLITVSQVILSFVAQQPILDIQYFLGSHGTSSSTYDPSVVAKRLADLGKQLSVSWTLLANQGAHSTAPLASLLELQSSLTTLEQTTNDVRAALGDQYTPILQAAGDNLRRCGNPLQPTRQDIKHIFALAERINRMVKCLRKLASLEGRPGFFAIDAFRNPFEVDYFRERYAAFYLLAINTQNSDRLARLNAKGLTTSRIVDLDEKEYPDTNDPLVDYEHFVSQNIQQCTQKADIHLNNPGLGSSEAPEALNVLTRQIIRYTSLIKHPGLVTPTKHERCMQIAFNAKVNSGCISRQVGAVVTDAYNAVKAIGWNDVPLGQTPCLLRDYDEFSDSADTLARKLPLPADSRNWTFLAGFCAGGKSDEEVAIHGIADRGDSEGRGSRVGGGAVGPQVRDQRGDVLPLEIEVRRGGGA